MSVDKVQKDLICRLLAELVEVDPKRVKVVLEKFQFKMGDVSFMVTDNGHFWTEVWKWPWEPLTEQDVKDALAKGAEQRKAAEKTLKTRGRY